MEFYFLSTTLLKEDLLNELGLSLNKHLLIYTDFKEPVVKLKVCTYLIVMLFLYKLWLSSLSLKDAEITKESTKSALEHNSVLTLPRISSSHIFDIVCPYGANTRSYNNHVWVRVSDWNFSFEAPLRFLHLLCVIYESQTGILVLRLPSSVLASHSSTEWCWHKHQSIFVI